MTTALLPQAPPREKKIFRSSLRCLIIGVGNRSRGDDGIGPVVAGRLKGYGFPFAEVIESPSDGAAMIEAWSGADSVILVDAVVSGAAPGTIHRLDPNRQPVPDHFSGGSTHAFNAAEAVELARALGRLPPSFVIYGIEARSFEPGAGMSPEVRKAGMEVTRRALEDLRLISAGVPPDARILSHSRSDS